MNPTSRLQEPLFDRAARLPSLDYSV